MIYNRAEQEAERLHVSRRTLVNWQGKGVIPFKRIGRVVLFSPDAVDAALSRFEVMAVGASRPRRGRKPVEA